MRKRAFLFMDVGLLALLMAAAMVVKTSLSSRGSVETTGTIVYDGRTHTPKTDRIRIQFSAGEQIIQLEETLAARSQLGIGDTVAVMYEANNPRRAHLAENLWLFPFLLFTTGLGAVGYSLRLRKEADHLAGVAALALQPPSPPPGM